METLPKPKLCVFDLDGTLVDSLRDIADAMNECLELLGLSTRDVADFRYMVGEGMPTLCSRAIGGLHPHLVGRLTELARPFYQTRALNHTRPYPGVPELVTRLRTAGVRLAVLSNKPHEQTVRIVRQFWPNGEFDAIYGYREEQYRKPSPHYLQVICRELGVAPTATWMIGDTPTDVETAAAAGTVGIGVTWGFRTRADLEAVNAKYICTRPEEIG